MKIALTAAALVPLAIAAPAFAAMAPSAYVMTAGASDLFERQSAQIVLQTTKDPKVRSFAEMMIRDHTKSTDMVKAAAMKSGLHPKPPMLMPKQTQMIADLRAAHGPARDSAYITQQKAAHQEALMVQQDYAANGTAPALRMAAGKIVPVVKHHIMMLDQM